MHKTFDFKKYVEYKVYSVTTIKNGYGDVYKRQIQHCRRQVRVPAVFFLENTRLGD